MILCDEESHLNQIIMNKKIKKIAYVAAGCVGAACLGTIAFIYGHKPDVVTNPCFRSTHRADGKPKKPFYTAKEANLQSVKQFLRHGEVCNAYQVGDKYYTGHSNKALIRSLNPFSKKVS